MNPQRAQMLREIRREYCPKCAFYEDDIKICKDLEHNIDWCEGFMAYCKDLLAEAEQQTEPKCK